MLDSSDPRLPEIKVAGYFVASAASAFVSLRMLAGPEVEAICAGVEPNGHYAYEHFNALLVAVSKRFREMDPVLEQLGIQMMSDWYERGPGKGIISRGVDFLQFQTSSQGYKSVVDGTGAATGAFTLETLDEAAGRACVRSTTPFPKAMERGVLIGGIRAPGDLTYVDVENESDPGLFNVTFR